MELRMLAERTSLSWVAQQVQVLSCPVRFACLAAQHAWTMALPWLAATHCMELIITLQFVLKDVFRPLPGLRCPWPVQAFGQLPYSALEWSVLQQPYALPDGLLSGKACTLLLSKAEQRL